MANKSFAYNASRGSDGLGSGAAMPPRRVIFPSLHRHSLSPSASAHQRPRSADQTHERGKSLDLTSSPTNVDASIQNADQKPILYRANSLDGIQIPLPKLSLEEVDKPSKKISPSTPQKNQRSTVQGPVGHIRDVPAHQVQLAAQLKLARARSSRNETKSPQKLFIGDLGHKTYYPAASVPTPVTGTKSPSPAKPAPPILRSSSSTLDEGDSIAFTPLSPAVPTLASPAAIKSLKPTRTDNDGQDSLGESEDGIERINDLPKILPRRRSPLRRNQSDTIVLKTEEGQSNRSNRSDSAASHESCVSRHESLECFGNKKKIMFDPHITVYEFRVSDYERRGGNKWWSEEELDGFKQEAINRIRQRSMRVIPTGTGRALAVTQDNNAAGNSSGGSILFSHPALGCDDPDAQRSRKPIGGVASQNNAPAVVASLAIRNILVVDPHEIFLALFTKSLKHNIPHASVATARSAEEAIARIEAAKRAFPTSDGGSTNGFDVILIEERLCGSFSSRQLPQHSVSTQTAGDISVQRRWNVASGSTLIHHLVESDQRLSKSERYSTLRRSLYVGVSAHLALDEDKLKRSGAHLVWPKPPPEDMHGQLMKALQTKETEAAVTSLN